MGKNLAVIVLVLGLFAGAGWLFRDDIADLFGGREPVEVSEEAAAIAEEKLVRLRDDGEPARLSSIEVSSLLRYRAPAGVLSRVHEPSVEFAGETVRIGGTIALADLPPHPELDRVRALLPDSSRVEASGRLGALPSGRSTVELDEVTFAGIPIPERYYAEVLTRFGRVDEPGLHPHAVPLGLPEGVGSVRVEDGYLLLNP